MAIPQRKDDYRYTYADYLSWPDEERWELIEGVPYGMSPAPGRVHQKIFGAMFNALYNHLSGNECEVYGAPLDVRLPTADDATDDTTYTVVQPDILVVCDRSRLDDRGCNGAPDICVEILSPATAYRDGTEKLRLYEKHAVTEYWLVNPDLETVTVYTLQDGEYGNPQMYRKRHRLTSTVLAGFGLGLETVF